MHKILLVDGQTVFQVLLLQYLGTNSFCVDRSADVRHAGELLRARDYSVIVLDQTASSIAAAEFCKQVRAAKSDVAIFVINAEPCGVQSERTISYGADDYLLKPTSARQLAAKIRAVVRRTTKQTLADRLVVGGLSLELSSGIVTFGGCPLRLRPMEYVLLEFFMRNQNRVFNAEQLWREVWKRRGPPTDTVRAHVNMLRRKLEADGDKSPIKTVKGRGYKFEATAASEKS